MPDDQIRAMPAQPAEPESFAWIEPEDSIPSYTMCGHCRQPFPAQALVPLTDGELFTLMTKLDPETVRLPIGIRLFARAVERAHGIGAEVKT